MAKIQVILTQDVAGQGRKGDLITVSDGYAKNFILNKNKGIIATAEALQKIENDKKKEAKRNEDEKNKAIILKNQLEKEKLVLTVKVGDNGKLFGAITNKEIAAEMEKSFGLKIDKKKIECSIKSLGEHKVTVKLHQDVKAEITVITKE
ncbi:50S ribosomal protein L9 [Fusobacterium perfoetens]|uniref:50S ribosomal protein L9 n=1 Tax=Fusobacterium perfoetens TaxID=852 RepID=UPI0015A02C06|nr:50S ribosomal protein L9 [Fusobacterium perfoetens]MCF2625189.1 50S ribosomal protein L9 [Fusobacterium perfoetens]